MSEPRTRTAIELVQLSHKERTSRRSRFHVGVAIAAGRPVPVLEDFNAGEFEMIHAVYVAHEHLVARIHAFVGFLAAQNGRHVSA